MKKMISILILICLIATGFQMFFVVGGSEKEIEISQETRGGQRGSIMYVGSGQTYTKIQDAIKASTNGDIIRVYAGNYYENIVISKRLTLIGNGSTTIINASGINDVVKITADLVTITGFKVMDSSNIGSGIYLQSSNQCKIEKCHFLNNKNGIYLNASSNNIIKDNSIESNSFNGIYLCSSSNNTITANDIFSNGAEGILLELLSTNNIIKGNNISSHNEFGIFLTPLTTFIGIAGFNDDGDYYFDVSYWYNASAGKWQYNLTGNGKFDPGVPDPIRRIRIGGDVLIADDGDILGIWDSGDTILNDPLSHNSSDYINNYRIPGMKFSGPIIDEEIHDKDGMMRWADDDGDWNWTNDDIGSDGIPGTNDADGTEGNGRPDPGEPHVDEDLNITLLPKPSKNIITENNLSKNNCCIYLVYTFSNILKRNIIENNYYGIYSEYSQFNSFYHNNLINNTNQAYDCGNNLWNASYTIGGNYWSDWISPDKYSGENQDILGNDGIVDKPYNISGADNAKDFFPLMSPVIIYNESINRAPVANAGLDQNAYINQIVNFDGSGSSDPDGDPITYIWDFGDGKTTRWQNSSKASNIYTKAGNFTVTLNVSDGSLWDIDICMVKVSKGPKLANSPWPKFRGNIRNTGLSKYDTKKNMGTIKWSFKTDYAIKSSPSIGSDGMIYFGSDDNHFYAIYPNGTKNWDIDFEWYVESSPAIDSNGTIYFGAHNRRFYAINPNGNEKWVFKTNGIVYSSPTIGSDGTIHFGSDDNHLYALYPNGTERWKFKTNGGIVSSPAIGFDDTIYVASRDLYLYAIYPNGTIKWKFGLTSSESSSPAIGSNGTVYICCSDDRIYAINPNGTKKWDFATEGEIRSTPAIGPDGTIYIGSYDRKLYAINPNGIEKWNFKTSNSVASSATIGSEGTIYFGSNDGFYAINPNSTVKWKISVIDSDVSSSAIGSDGTLYITSFDGHLYAIGDNITEQNRPPIANAGPDQNVGVYQTVYFDGNGSYDLDGDPLTYNWDFDDGATTGWQNNSKTSHSYNQPGNYIVTLTVSDGSLTGTDTCILNIDFKGNNPPIANAGNDQTVEVGQIMYFDGSRSIDPDGDSLTYIWGFGDGTATDWQSNSKTSHIYKKVGEYKAKLIVSDGTLRNPDICIISVIDKQPEEIVDNLISANAEDHPTYLKIKIAEVSGTPLTLSDAKIQMLTKARTSVFTKSIHDANPNKILTGGSSVYPIPSNNKIPVFENPIIGDGQTVDSDSAGYAQRWEGCYFAYIDDQSDDIINRGDMIWLFNDWDMDDADDLISGYSIIILDKNDKVYMKKDLGKFNYNEFSLKNDTDFDGLPNYWEENHGLNYYNPNDADIDSDNDSLSNLMEYLYEADPNNPDTDGDTFSDGSDAFPIDPAASMDSDGDNYPNYWNPGKSEKDSTTGLTLDAHPLDANQPSKESPKNYLLVIILIVLVVIILLTIASIKLIVMRSKRHREGKAYTSDIILEEVRYKILHGEKLQELDYSRDEIEKLLENQFKKGAISANTHEFLRSNILYSEEPTPETNENDNIMDKKH